MSVPALADVRLTQSRKNGPFRVRLAGIRSIAAAVILAAQGRENHSSQAVLIMLIVEQLAQCRA